MARAPGSGAIAPGRARGPAAQRRSRHEQMTFARSPGHPSDQPGQVIAGSDRPGRRTGMARTAGTVHLPSGDAGQPQAHAFGTPDRAIAVPDPHRRAAEGLAWPLASRLRRRRSARAGERDEQCDRGQADNHPVRIVAKAAACNRSRSNRPDLPFLICRAVAARMLQSSRSGAWSNSPYGSVSSCPDHPSGPRFVITNRYMRSIVSNKATRMDLNHQ